MSKEFNIQPKDALFIGDAKNLRIYVTGADGLPVNLGGKNCYWYLRRGPDLLLTKTPADIVITNGNGVNDLAIVPIIRADTIDGLGNILIEPGIYSHALKDASDDATLSYGDFPVRLSAAR